MKYTCREVPDNTILLREWKQTPSNSFLSLVRDTPPFPVWYKRELAQLCSFSFHTDHKYSPIKKLCKSSRKNLFLSVVALDPAVTIFTMGRALLVICICVAGYGKALEQYRIIYCAKYNCLFNLLAWQRKKNLLKHSIAQIFNRNSKT